MLGQNIVNSKSSSSVLSSTQKDVGKVVNKAASDIAKQLNIHDFYSAHVLSFCEVRCLRNSSNERLTRDVLANTESLCRATTPRRLSSLIQKRK